METCSSAACFSGPCERTPRRCSRAPAPPSAGRCRSRFRCRVGLRAIDALIRFLEDCPELRLELGPRSPSPGRAIVRPNGGTHGGEHSPCRTNFAPVFASDNSAGCTFRQVPKLSTFTFPLFTFPPRSAADARGSATTRTVRVGGSAGPPTAARPRG